MSVWPRRQIQSRDVGLFLSGVAKSDYYVSRSMREMFASIISVTVASLPDNAGDVIWEPRCTRGYVIDISSHLSHNMSPMLFGHAPQTFGVA